MDEAEGKPARPRRGWRRGLRIALASLALLVLVLEVPVRGLLWLRPEVLGTLRPDLHETIANSRLEAHPYMGYAAKPGFENDPDSEHHITHNEWGFRGPALPLEKGPNTYRIVCLGGSSTYGHTPSSDAATWPARLQHWLNQQDAHGKRVEVINGGLSGWSTFESTVNLAFRMVEWRPDLVIVYHTINDARCALYRLREPRMDNRHWRDTWPRVVEAPGERLLEHSITYLLLRKTFTDYVDAVDALDTHAIVGADFDEPDWYLREEVPERGFLNFERNLRSINALATEHGARVILATQAMDERDIQAPSRQLQLDSMARMSEILRSVAAEVGAVFVDAEAELEAVAAEVGIDRIFTKDVHLTDEGANRLALVFARAILKGGHGLLDS